MCSAPLFFFNLIFDTLHYNLRCTYTLLTLSSLVRLKDLVSFLLEIF